MSKLETNPNIKFSNALSQFGHSNFDIVSDSGFRISNFSL